MNIGFFQEQEIKQHLGKATRPSPAWTPGKKFTTLSSPGSTRVQVYHGDQSYHIEDSLQRRKFIKLLSAQLQYSDQQNLEAPLRAFFMNTTHLVEVAQRFARALDELLDDQRCPLALADEKSLRHEQETWSLVATLLPAIHQGAGEEKLRMKVLQWLRIISRTYIARQLQSFENLAPDERYLRTLGLLVAAGLNLDAARLAITEGEMSLGQLLMCKEYPDFSPCLMKSYQATIREQIKDRANPLLLGIFDLLADWRIRLSVCLSTKRHLSLQDAIKQFYDDWKMDKTLEDIQFQLLFFFCQVNSGTTIRIHQILQLVSRRPERKNGIDDLMAWQLFTLLSSLEPTAKSSPSHEEVFCLFNDLCEECESLKLPEWSVFVALHRDASPLVVKNHVRKILESNITMWIDKPDLQSFMTSTLHIQSSFLAEAKAAWYRSLQSHQLEFECWIDAERYEEAHHVLILKNHSEDLTSIQSFNLNSKLQVLHETHLIEHQHKISRWKHGGGIIVSLCYLLERSARDRRALLELLNEIKSFRKDVLESREYWMHLSESTSEREWIKKLFGMILLKVEVKYSDSYCAVNGSDDVMSKILKESCSVREYKTIF